VWLLLRLIYAQVFADHLVNLHVTVLILHLAFDLSEEISLAWFQLCLQHNMRYRI